MALPSFCFPLCHACHYLCLLWHNYGKIMSQICLDGCLKSCEIQENAFWLSEILISFCGLKPIYIRRQELCERFAVKTASQNSRHNDLFQLEKNGTHYTRSDNSRFREHICNKSRFFKSPLPFLTRTLNEL